MIGAERDTPVIPVAAEITEAKTEKNQNPGRLRLVGKWALKTVGMVTASALSFGITEYQADINDVNAMLAHTHPYIIENSAVPDVASDPLPVPEGVYRAMDSEDKAYIDSLIKPHRLATVNVPGFGLVDTHEGGRVFEPFESMGASWSMHWDNAGIDIHNAAEVIVDEAHDENVDEIGFDADSMGNIIATKLAVEIEKIDPLITVPFIVMDSPAVGLQVLRPKSRSDGFAMLDGLKWLPGSDKSRYDRFVAEVYLRLDKIHDLASFQSVINEVHAEVFDNKDMAANTLLAEQFQMIMSADVEGDMQTLGKVDPSKRPVIVFMGAAHAKDDDVVNTPKSYELIKKWTKEAGLTLLGPFGIEDFYHGAQYRSMSEYHDVLRNEVIPGITAAIASQENQLSKPSENDGEVLADGRDSPLDVRDNYALAR